MTNYLNQSEYDLFFKIHKNILLFTNKITKVSKKFKKLDDWGEYDNFMNDACKLRNKLFDNKNLIDQFIKENPANFNQEELEITKNWKKAVTGNFIILKHLKKHSIFLHNESNQIYAIIGLMQPIEEVAPKECLPVLVGAALIPFQGKIVYDGVLSGGNVIIGNNYKREFNEKYMDDKKAKKIIEKI